MQLPGFRFPSIIAPVRLDLFLKASRLVQRRGIAKRLCDAGLVKVNGLAAKASKEVQAGDQIELRRAERRVIVRVVRLPAAKQLSKSESATLYEAVTDERISELPELD
jgi:ribosomal 50S subunit-recycling heat shock protein